MRRFTAQEDNAQWIDRLKIVGIDLRIPTRSSRWPTSRRRNPLDILISNYLLDGAAQLRRHPSRGRRERTALPAACTTA